MKSSDSDYKLPFEALCRYSDGYLLCTRLCQINLQGKKILDKEEGDKRRSGKPIIASWHCSLHGGAPLVISWFISPMNTIDISPISHSHTINSRYITNKNHSELGGITHQLSIQELELWGTTFWVPIHLALSTEE